MKKMNIFDFYQKIGRFFPVSIGNFRPEKCPGKPFPPHPLIRGGAPTAFNRKKADFLAGFNHQKSYQIKQINIFPDSGSHEAELLSGSIPARGGFPPDFLPKPGISGRSGRLNTPSGTENHGNFPFLKKEFNLINQSESNYNSISANRWFNCEENLFFESNLTGNNQQQKDNYRHSPRYAGQIQGFRINHLTPLSKNSDRYKDIIPYTTKNLSISAQNVEPINVATNQATAILEKNSDRRFVCAGDNSINSAYHNLCN